MCTPPSSTGKQVIAPKVVDRRMDRQHKVKFLSNFKLISYLYMNDNDVMQVKPISAGQTL